MDDAEEGETPGARRHGAAHWNRRLRHRFGLDHVAPLSAQEARDPSTHLSEGVGRVDHSFRVHLSDIPSNQAQLHSRLSCRPRRRAAMVGKIVADPTPDDSLFPCKMTDGRMVPFAQVSQRF